MQEMQIIKKRIRRKRRRRRITITLTFVIILLIISLLPVFKIGRIDIKGTANTQVMGYINSLKGQNIWWHRLDTIQKKTTSFPNIKSATAKRHFPNVLEILVQERTRTAFVFVANKFVIISEDGVVLEVTDATPAKLIEIKGLTSANIKLGENFIEIGTDNYNKYVCIVSEFADYGLLNKIKYIDLSAKSTAIIKHNNFTIDFGKTDFLDNKMKLLNEIINSSSTETKAEIDVSNGKKAYFKEIY